MLDVKMYRLRVKEVAKQKGFSISKLSRVADVPIKTVRRAWNDPRYPIQLPSLERLARALQVPVTELIEDIPDDEIE
jgi:transcriptional regulator with XRE-family HTH domain